MGNCVGGQEKKEMVDVKLPVDPKEFREDHFTQKCVIGRGQFGKVTLVKIKGGLDDQLFAMKKMRKTYVVCKNSIENIRMERRLMTICDHPFLCKLHFAFQDKGYLYLIMDFVNGGDILYHLKKEKSFDEGRVKFYISEIALAIKYLHENKIIHRDLKPENVLLDSTGHIKLTDFGLSKILENSDDRCNTLCGTPYYVAPEMAILSGSEGSEKTYDKMVDYWSLGVLCYELLFGSHPFSSDDPSEVFKKIQTDDVVFPFAKSEEITDFIKRLLEKDPKKRLGAKGPDEVFEHPFLKDVDCEKLERLQIDPPFVPQVKGKNDTNYIDSSLLSENPKKDEVLTSEELEIDREKMEKHETDFSSFYFSNMSNEGEGEGGDLWFLQSESGE